MTVLRASAQYAIDQSRPLNADSAYERCHQAALTEGEVGAVGLEIEAHLVNLDSVGDRVAWDRVQRMLTTLGTAAGHRAISLEPGGQLELSGPPAPDIQTAVTSLRHDMVGTRLGIADLRLGMAYSGADPLRPSRRINPRPRYLAMEQHFAAPGRGAATAVMMNSTAA